MQDTSINHKPEQPQIAPRKSKECKQDTSINLPKIHLSCPLQPLKAPEIWHKVLSEPVVLILRATTNRTSEKSTTSFFRRTSASGTCGFLFTLLPPRNLATRKSISQSFFQPRQFSCQPRFSPQKSLRHPSSASACVDQRKFSTYQLFQWISRKHPTTRKRDSSWKSHVSAGGWRWDFLLLLWDFPCALHYKD